MEELIERDVPICVDLDGTLLRTDSLVESLLMLMRLKPMVFLVTLLYVFKGRAYLKWCVAKCVTEKMDFLPKNEQLIKWLRHQSQSGRSLILVTAANQIIAENFAHQLDFKMILASDEHCNLKGKKKAERLVSLFGNKSFDYVGNSRSDLAVWRHARCAVVVGSNKLAHRAETVSRVVKVFEVKDNILSNILRAMRFHQWSKNLLLLLPLLASHQVFNFPKLSDSIFAFFVFSFTASAIYIINDMLDLEADRQHKTKKNRPLAAGDLPLAYGLIFPPILLLTAGILSFSCLSATFSAVVLLYVFLSVGYSLKFKKIVMIDVLILTLLYVIRIIAGGVAVNIYPSLWLLAFSTFIFFSLALVKRFSEILGVNQIQLNKIPGRGWQTNDLSFVGTIGIASGVVSVLVLALYVNSEQAHQLYSVPEILWCVCPVTLYWISYIWLKSYRGEVDEDPIVFSIKDLNTLVVGAIVFLLAIISRFGCQFIPKFLKFF